MEKENYHDKLCEEFHSLSVEEQLSFMITEYWDELSDRWEKLTNNEEEFQNELNNLRNAKKPQDQKSESSDQEEFLHILTDYNSDDVALDIIRANNMEEALDIAEEKTNYLCHHSLVKMTEENIEEFKRYFK